MRLTWELETILKHPAIRWRDESRVCHVMLWFANYPLPECPANAWLDSGP